MAIYTDQRIDQWKQNIAQFQKDPEHFHLTSQLQLKEGGGALPEAAKVIAFLRKEKAFHPDNQSNLNELFVRLGLIYHDSPCEMKIFQWMRASLPTINQKNAYLERLQKVMTIFYSVRDFNRNQVERGLLFSKGLDIGRKLKERNIQIFYEKNVVQALVFPEATSTKEIAFLIAYFGEVKKRNPSACQKGSVFAATNQDQRKSRSFLEMHMRSNDPSVKNMAESILFQYDLENTVDQLKKITPCDLSDKRESALLNDWALDVEEYFPHFAVVVDQTSRFYQFYGEHENFQLYSPIAVLNFIDVQAGVGQLNREVKEYESLYLFFSQEMSRIAVGTKSHAYRKIYAENMKLPSHFDFLAIQPREIDLSLTCEKEESPPPTPVDQSDFLPDYLKQPSKKGKVKKPTPKPKKQPPKEKEAESILPREEVQIKTSQVSWRQQIGIGDAVPLIYAEHVTRWFNRPEEVLQTDEYVSQNPMAQDWAIYAHTFPQLVDQFVGTPYCHEGVYENPRTGSKDCLYSIPGEITTPKGMQRVLFQYAVDARTKVCYHRCIHRITNDKFIQTLLDEKVWSRIDFPTIEEGMKLQDATPMKYKESEVPFTYEPTFGSVSFDEGDFSITLFRLEF